MLARDKKRFWSRVSIIGTPSAACWIWTGYKRDYTREQYGFFKLKGKVRPAHRVAYEDIIGPIPSGLVLDHLCRNPSCVNPFHLEPVTRQVNTQRGRSAAVIAEWHKRHKRRRKKTHCKRGHPFTSENTYVPVHWSGRRCRACQALHTKEWRRRKKECV
jgi:hypothetical protein